MNKYDLHIHSEFSDGEYSVQEIIRKLRDNEINIFSITDHDNLESISEVYKNDLSGLVYIPGIELSCESNNYRMHILGYGIDHTNEELIKLCRNMKLIKTIRNLETIKQLKEKHNIAISREETEELLSKKGFVGQVTIAKLLVQKGIIPNVRYAFDNYFKGMDLGRNATVGLEEAISTIHSAGGYAVLAHPITLEEENNIKIKDIFQMFLDSKIDGIELFNSKHTLSDIKRYLELAKNHNLLISGGSDFHGEIVKPNIKLGGLSRENIQKNHHDKINIIDKCVKRMLQNEKSEDEMEL